MTIVPFLQKVSSVILNPLMELVFAIAFVYFVYGVVKFLSTDAADKSRIEARNAIFWGLVGMLIMFSTYGIIRFVLATFQVDPNPGTTYILK
ncbi:MAG: hypothetical protein V4473_01415 [Patescibacteria group bacterium]